MFSPLSAPSTSGPPQPRSVSTRRPATIDLELQSACKFGLAVGLGVGAVLATGPIVGAALMLIIAVILAGLSLSVMAHDPSSPSTVRPRELALWDGALAALLAIIAVVLVTVGSPVGGAIAGTAAVLLAALRLRTRYVAL